MKCLEIDDLTGYHKCCYRPYTAIACPLGAVLYPKNTEGGNVTIPGEGKVRVNFQGGV